MILCRQNDMTTPEETDLPEEHTLTLYALLNVWEPPRRLSRDVCDKDIGECEEICFHCDFQLPLPNQILIFGLGKWELNLKGYEMVAEVSINAEIPPQKIGVLSCGNKVLCWEEGWTANFSKKSDELHEQGQMAKLTLKAVKVSSFSDKENTKNKGRTVLSPPQQHFDCDINSPGTPGYFKNLKQTKLTFAECGEVEGCSETMTPPAKKRRKSIAETPLQCGRRRHSMQDTTRSKGSPRIQLVKSRGIPTPAPHTPSHSESMPTGRWGHGMCLIDNSKAVLVGGQGGKLQMVKDSVWTLDMSLGDNIWQQETCERGGADRRIGHTVTYDPDKKVVYVYGGSKNKRWFSDVNILDLQTNIWSAVKAVGNAPTRAYHSCNLFLGELLVFGGVFPNPDPQPDSCSNELYIFNTDAKNWYKPITTGTPPCPKSGHSASLLGDRLVLFGGWDFPQCFNDVSIIDLAIMEFTSPTTTGLPPSPRTWHAVAVLPKQRIFIHGGFDGNQILKDSFIFEFETLTWTQLRPPDHLTARAGHVALHMPTKSNSNEEQEKDQICIFGGGNNAGGFFNDLVVFSP